MIALVADYRFGCGQAGVGLLAAGWATPEPDFVWSVGHASTLHFPPEAIRDANEAELLLEPFIAPPRLRYQVAELHLNGTSCDIRRIGGPHTWRVALPRGLASSGLTVMLRRMPGAPGPAALGLPDSRNLGFKLLGLKLLATRQAALPTPRRTLIRFKFGWNEPTEACLTDGWADPEDGFVWALGRRSTLRLPLAGIAGPVLLLLDMRPFETRSGPVRQRLVIGADGRLLRFLDLRRRMCIALKLDPAPGATHVTVHVDAMDAEAQAASLRHASGQPYAWALDSACLTEPPATLAAAALPRVPGTLADGSLAHAVHARTGLALDAVAAGYESVSDSCSLGLLQRRLGREQVGLLRYAAALQHRLVGGLLAGFADLGRPDALMWDVRVEADQTWRMIDLVYELSLATPFSRFQEPPAGEIARFGRSLPWLAAKLMRDIAAAEKIFAVRLPHANDEAAALAILAVLRVFGDAQLLWLVEDSPALAGGVERLSSGLLVGYLDPAEYTDIDRADATLLSVLANALTLAR